LAKAIKLFSIPSISTKSSNSLASGAKMALPSGFIAVICGNATLPRSLIAGK